MPRSRRTPVVRASARRLARDRHGRGMRSAVTGPDLPMLHSRITLFDATIASTVSYLRGLWPQELAGLTVEVVAAPSEAIHEDHIDRWKVDVSRRLIVFFRLPILRFSHLEDADEFHGRMLIESCVFRAIAELIDKDPWDLAPDRFRQF